MRGELVQQRFQDDERSRQEEELAGVVHPVPTADAQERIEDIPDGDIRQIAHVHVITDDRTRV
ncbi:hypothetical protein EKD04_025035 [Chloroflexales bacterium ZM16-3]|nr:hypothetical protein [Chloroflexales bacterium ZM16-3]